MKIAFGMIILDGDFVLKQTLQTIYPYASQILISEGPVKYWQNKGVLTSSDRTNEILDTFPDPDNKIKIIHSQYDEKDEQCNAYMQYLNDDTDYIWNLDSDEVFLPSDIEKIFRILEEEKYTSVGFKSLTFYGGFDRYLTGFEENAEFIRIRKVYPKSFWSTHRPPTIHHVWGGPKLPEKHLNFNTCANEYGIRMYHYSYVFPRQVFNKIRYYRESVNPNGTIENYFQNVYLPWVNGDDSKKMEIENKYNGVHEFLVHMRGDCRTEKFTGEHPDIIKKSLEELKEQFKKELEYYEKNSMV